MKVLNPAGPEDVVSTLAKTCQDVAAELLSQRDFFDFHREEFKQSERELTAARYSGLRSNDEETNLRVGAMRLLGFSDRHIERECGIDRRTIPHRLEWCAQAGRIPAQKDRLLRLVGESAEKAGMALPELLERVRAGETSTELASLVKAVATALGITVEKVQLLTGSPTEILEQRVGAGREQIESWWREMAVPVQATSVPIESASTEITTETQQSTPQMAAGHVPDTAGTPNARTEAPAEPGADRAGGGSEPGASAAATDGSTGL